ncbi:hypothetical protein EJB05_49815, partial [Eragrostis curvula]
MTEAGGVLDPFSAFIPMRISSTSKQEFFFNSDSLARSQRLDGQEALDEISEVGRHPSSIVQV